MSEPDDRLASHFDEVTGLLYLEGQLDDEHAHEVSDHIAACPACGQLLRALQNESIWLKEALAVEEESIPAHLISAPQRNSAHWGWIAALTLCAAGFYTLWTGYIQPSLAGASQAGFSQGGVLQLIFFEGAFWKGWDAMRSMTELLAIATLGGLAIWLLRRQWRRFTAISFVMGALILGLAVVPSAFAADVERGTPSNPTYTLPAGQEVMTDLIVLADRVRIDGDVDGDLIAFSQDIVVNGHIKGDVIAFGQEVRVNGPVDGNVRAWCQTLSLQSTVSRNVSGFVSVAELADKATVGGTMSILGGNTELDGHIAGDLLVLSGELDIEGSLGRNADIRADHLRIGPKAEIQGYTKYAGRHQPDVASGAKLGSPIQVTIPRTGPDYTRVRYYWHRVLLWGASFLFGLLLMLLAPGFFADAEHAASRFGPAVGFGALFLFATPVAIVIACITIVGLSIGLTAALLYVIAIYAAQIFVAAWLGEKLLGGAAPGLGAAIGRLALGLAVVRVALMLPYFGGLADFLIIIWGMGALILAVHRRIRPHVAAAATA